MNIVLPLPEGGDIRPESQKTGNPVQEHGGCDIMSVPAVRQYGNEFSDIAVQCGIPCLFLQYGVQYFSPKKGDIPLFYVKTDGCQFLFGRNAVNTVGMPRNVFKFAEDHRGKLLFPGMRQGNGPFNISSVKSIYMNDFSVLAIR